jgi:hypothetical protein
MSEEVHPGRAMGHPDRMRLMKEEGEEGLNWFQPLMVS